MTRCWISQGCLLRFFGYLMDILKLKNPEWDIPNQWKMYYKQKIWNGIFQNEWMVFQRYLSLFLDIFHCPIPSWFSRIQLIAWKSFLAQPKLLPKDYYILLHTAHAVHQAQAYLFSFPAHALGKAAGIGAWFAASAAPSTIDIAFCQGIFFRCRCRLRLRLDALTKLGVTSLCYSTCSLHSNISSYEAHSTVTETAESVSLCHDQDLGWPHPMLEVLWHRALWECLDTISSLHHLIPLGWIDVQGSLRIFACTMHICLQILPQHRTILITNISPLPLPFSHV